MTRLTNERRVELLQLLSFDRGHVEPNGGQALASHYPIKEHLQALEPDVVFVLGPRGSGKSSLVMSISSPEHRAALARFAGVRLPGGGGVWARGYPYGALGPSSRAWEDFARNSHSAPLQMLWLSILVRCLDSQLDDPAKGQLRELLAAPSGPDALYTAGKASAAIIEQVLDELDSKLREKGAPLFVTYDELDALFFTEWATMMRVIQALMGMWAGYYRRWQFIRPKFFVRTDLFTESAQLSTSDIAKMSARRVDLHWSSRNLYGALFHHIMSRDQLLEDYFDAALPTKKFEGLGELPQGVKESDFEPAVKRLCGAYMGASSNKGHTLTWLIRAVRDGANHASPRNLVRLIEHAAIIEQERPRVGTHSQLLHHVSLRKALTRVSEEHVRESMSSEHPWLYGLRERLAASREVPWERGELEQCLGEKWEAPWSANSEGGTRPPASTEAELLDHLLQLGIFRERKVVDRSRRRDRPYLGIDVPDLYLEGLRLIRRGGVARS